MHNKTGVQSFPEICLVLLKSMNPYIAIILSLFLLMAQIVDFFKKEWINKFEDLKKLFLAQFLF